jgi:GT2 family glycosyltransferase
MRLDGRVCPDPAATEPELRHEAAGASLPRVGVVILNWNGWCDTVACLESVCRTERVALDVVVCDNASTDDSIWRIREWAAGRLPLPPLEHPVLRASVTPPLPKPVPLVEYDRAEAEKGGAGPLSPSAVVLVHNGGNLGFAGGSNVGIRYLLARGVEYVWLLNNDTVVPAESLRRMVDRLDRDEQAGLCGSTLVYYAEPDMIQARGGFVYDRWQGLVRHIDQFQPVGPVTAEYARRVEEEMAGVQGASTLLTRRFLEQVGLLSEDYFLYYEELDWAIRARRAGYRLVYAAESVVYHKEGGTTGGTSRRPGPMSEVSDYHSIRSRLVFTRKFYPYALPLIYGTLGLMVAWRLVRGQRDRAAVVVRAAGAARRPPQAGER